MWSLRHSRLQWLSSALLEDLAGLPVAKEGDLVQDTGAEAPPLSPVDPGTDCGSASRGGGGRGGEGGEGSPTGPSVERGRCVEHVLQGQRRAPADRQGRAPSLSGHFVFPAGDAVPVSGHRERRTGGTAAQSGEASDTQLGQCGATGPGGDQGEGLYPITSALN